MGNSLHFIQLLSDSLASERKAKKESKKANTLLAALLEIRESALKNNKQEVAQEVDQKLAAQGIFLKEEKRIIISTEAK